MYFANFRFRLLGAYAISAMAVLCLSGCMLYPQDGHWIGSRSDSFDWAGVTTIPEERIAIQARNVWTNEWETIRETTANDEPTESHGETWYMWYRRAAVPPQYWQHSSRGYYTAELRAISLERNFWKSPALLTFKQGLSLEYSDVWSIWEEHGHGRSLTIYAWTR